MCEIVCQEDSVCVYVTVCQTGQWMCVCDCVSGGQCTRVCGRVSGRTVYECVRLCVSQDSGCVCMIVCQAGQWMRV